MVNQIVGLDTATSFSHLSRPAASGSGGSVQVYVLFFFNAYHGNIVFLGRDSDKIIIRADNRVEDIL